MQRSGVSLPNWRRVWPMTQTGKGCHKREEKRGQIWSDLSKCGTIDECGHRSIDYRSPTDYEIRMLKPPHHQAAVQSPRRSDR